MWPSSLQTGQTSKTGGHSCEGRLSSAAHRTLPHNRHTCLQNEYSTTPTTAHLSAASVSTRFTCCWCEPLLPPRVAEAVPPGRNDALSTACDWIGRNVAAWMGSLFWWGGTEVVPPSREEALATACASAHRDGEESGTSTTQAGTQVASGSCPTAHGGVDSFWVWIPPSRLLEHRQAAAGSCGLLASQRICKQRFAGSNAQLSCHKYRRI